VFADTFHLFKEGLPGSTAGRGSASTCHLVPFISSLDQPHLLSDLVVFSLSSQTMASWPRWEPLLRLC